MNLTPRLRFWFFVTPIVVSIPSLGAAAWGLWPLVEVHLLIHDLSDPDPSVRRYAARELGEIGPVAADASAFLAPMLQDDDPELRAAAAYALTRIGENDDNVLSILLEPLANEPLYYNRSPCGHGYRASAADDSAGYLRSIGSRAVPVLTAALDHPSHNLRAWAAEILGRIGPEARESEAALKQLMKDDDAFVRSVAVYSLWRVSLNREAVEPALIDGLAGSDSLVAPVFENLISSMEGDAGVCLAQAAKNDNVRVRLRAIQLLGGSLYWPGSIPPRSAAALTDALSDTDLDVRLHAALGLANARAPSTAISVLVEGLRAEDAEERAAAVRGLGAIGPTAAEAVPALLPLLGDPDHEVRANAAATLGAIGVASDAVVDALVQSLRDSTHSVRQAAAESLGRLGLPANSALPALRNLATEDKFVGVRMAATRAIDDITAPKQNAGTNNRSPAVFSSISF